MLQAMKVPRALMCLSRLLKNNIFYQKMAVFTWGLTVGVPEKHNLGYEKEESRRTPQILDYASGKMELLSAEMRKTLEGAF